MKMVHLLIGRLGCHLPSPYHWTRLLPVEISSTHAFKVEEEKLGLSPALAKHTTNLSDLPDKSPLWYVTFT
jgi:hypothetical protein